MLTRTRAVVQFPQHKHTQEAEILHDDETGEISLSLDDYWWDSHRLVFRGRETNTGWTVIQTNAKETGRQLADQFVIPHPVVGSPVRGTYIERSSHYPGTWEMLVRLVEPWKPLEGPGNTK